MEETRIEIRSLDPISSDATSLIDELSGVLAEITGRDGRDSFSSSDVVVPRSLFLVAYESESPVGCGALRPIDESTCEIKRMFTRRQGRGIGKKLLAFMEASASKMGYQKILLETGVQNQTAIKFYLRNGYAIRENYGKYLGRSECICFEKKIRD